MKFLSATLIALALASPFPAFAQGETITPEASTATYRDWTLRCDHLPETPPRRICEIAQAVRANDGQTVLAQIVMGRLTPESPVKLIVQLPAGVWLPANVSFIAPSGETATAIYTRCQQLCVADVDTDQSLIDALKSATEPAILSFQDGNRTPIEIPISLNGFTAAFNQMGQ